MASSSNKKPANKLKVAEAPVSEVKIPGGHDAFREEIQKSRAMIENSDAAPEVSQKKRPGRPSKEELAAKEAAVKAAQAAEIQNLVPDEGLKALLQLPFHLAAMQTGFEGFQLTEKEALSLCPSAHTLLLKYAPQLNGENMALMAFSGALFSIGLSKYMAFIHFRNQGPGQKESVPPPSGNLRPAPVPEIDPITGFEIIKA